MLAAYILKFYTKCLVLPCGMWFSLQLSFLALSVISSFQSASLSSGNIIKHFNCLVFLFNYGTSIYETLQYFSSKNTKSEICTIIPFRVVIVVILQKKPWKYKTVGATHAVTLTVPTCMNALHNVSHKLAPTHSRTGTSSSVSRSTDSFLVVSIFTTDAPKKSDPSLLPMPSLNVTWGFCFYWHAKRSHQVESNTDRNRLDLNWRSSHQDPSDNFWYKDTAARFKKYMLVFCFGAQILIQNQIIAAGIPFFQTLLFPICLEPTLFSFQPCAISCSGRKSKQVGSNWQDKQTIPSPSFWETAAIDRLCVYIWRRIVECFLSLLLKEFMADHHKETKCSYLWHESIMIGIKEPHVDNKSR